MTKPTLGILAMSALLGFGCGKEAPTQQGQPASALLVTVSLSRLAAAAGVKHAALATFFVRENLGRSLALEDVTAYNYAGTAHVEVSGFAPLRLAGHQSTSFEVTLSSNDDIPCNDELFVSVAFDNGVQKGVAGGEYFCGTDWLF